MTNPTSPGGAGEALAKKLQDRRKGGCETPPCAEYVVKNPDDYGYASCQRCGWSEPEHIIDQLAALLTEQSRQQEALTPETVAPWVQIRAGSELSELVRLIRSKREPEAYFHSDYEASGLLWRWALKWARHMAAPPQPKEPR
jgi:hypothetical protein